LTFLVDSGESLEDNALSFNLTEGKTMTSTKFKTRETWLEAAIKKLNAKYFRANGYELPKRLQVSCGFAKGSHKAIGQCWSPVMSANMTTQMFICPSIDDAVETVAILLHEMIHASVGTKAGHRGPFRKLALEFGLAGPMKATFAEVGSKLHVELSKIVESLGAYPHAKLRKDPNAKKNPYIWLRFVSITEKTYTITLSEKNAKEHGIPVDPWGDEMVPAPTRGKG